MIKNKIGCLLWLLLAMAVYVADSSYWKAGIFVFSAAAVLGAKVFSLLAGKGLSVQIKLPRAGQKAKEFPVILQIHNSSLLPVFYGVLFLEWKNCLTGESGKLKVPFAVSGRKHAEVSFQGKSRFCGCCVIAVKDYRIYDLFRIFYKKRKITEKTAGILAVMPEVSPVSMDLMGKEVYDIESFRYSQIRSGDDPGEVFEIREYRTGDNIKQIHWKLTQKLGSPAVKESGYPVYDSVLLLADMENVSGQVKDAAEQNAMAEVFASVAMALVDEGIPFEICFYDKIQQHLYLERIESLEMCWNVLEAMMRSQGEKTEKATALYYLEEAADRSFAHYLYIAGEEFRQEADRLRELGKVTQLCCGKTFKVTDNEIVFTAERWKEELAGY